MKITLTEWEVFCILKELEYNMRFINRDITMAKAIYEKIANQLDEQNVVIETKENSNEK